MYGLVNIFQRRINRVALAEFNLAILTLLIKDALSLCSLCCFMLRWLSIWTPKNLTDSVTFNRCPYIVTDVPLMTFLSEKLIRCVFPGLSFILHLSHQALCVCVCVCVWSGICPSPWLHAWFLDFHVIFHAVTTLSTNEDVAKKYFNAKAFLGKCLEFISVKLEG